MDIKRILKIAAHNVFETLVVMLTVSYFSSDIRFNTRKVIEISLVSALFLTIFEAEDDTGAKNAIRSGLLAGLGTKLY